MEIERKFTIKHLPWNLHQYETRQIEQAYLCSDPVVRIRRSNDRYILTYKAKAMPGADVCVNEEIEAPLTKEAYAHLREKADAHPITKTRYLIPLEDGYLAELDGGDVVVYGAVDGIGYGAGLFADDDGEDVELFGDADGGAVAQAEVGVDVEA